jgi:hypothetical protein
MEIIKAQISINAHDYRSNKLSLQIGAAQIILQEIAEYTGEKIQ